VGILLRKKEKSRVKRAARAQTRVGERPPSMTTSASRRGIGTSKLMVPGPSGSTWSRAKEDAHRKEHVRNDGRGRHSTGTRGELGNAVRTMVDQRLGMRTGNRRFTA